MARPGRKKQGDDAAWAEPAIGEDPDKAKRMPGAGTGVVSRVAETFWRECDTINLSIPRWGSRPRMNANIQFLLKTYPEDVVKASFAFFRNDAPNLLLDREHPCWEVYFRKRGAYLRSAERSGEGRRSGQAVRKAGDITVDNDRFRVREPGDAIDTDEI